MNRVNFVEVCTGVKVDDPDVLQAMEVWDSLNEAERTNLYRSTIQHMIAYRRTSDGRHLTDLAGSYEAMFQIAAIPGLRDKIRATREAPPPRPADEADIKALIARLRGQEPQDGGQDA
jgi:hypothetical protein